ncbi:hypothetical protein [[Kitasatospora] papulosa]|uniref:hypothetical protein n=1 Tax=[Kitasatospora] papulosa TaxID=1464011 RepID=UPI002E34152E|nr:hypothetical protein [[Kitasatospora] papulosa]
MTQRQLCHEKSGLHPVAGGFVDLVSTHSPHENRGFLMTKNNGVRAVPKNTGITAPQLPAHPVQADLPGQGRLTAAHVLPLIAFPMIGCLLYIVGDMPVTDVFTFLGGCGGIGALATVAVTGGRRVAVAIAHGILAASGIR